jgi:hypothetical protein
MKKFLIAAMSVLLVAVMAVALVACGSKEPENAKAAVNPNDPKKNVSSYEAKGYEPSTLKNQVSWEGINSFKSTKEIAELYKTDPQAAIAEARKVTVEFFTYAKTATWIPADNWDFTHHSDGTGPDSMTGGQVYGGLPYVGLASSGIYRLMDFIDEETGVVDILTAGGEMGADNMPVKQKYFGNQCAQGAYQGWARFINSAKYAGTPTMTVSRNFIRVGDYTYPDYVTNWTESYNTVAVCKENGDQVMWESYAKLVPGDGVINFTTAGHVMMIVSEPVVVRNADGTINGNQSYLYITDQHVQFENYTHPDGGDQCLHARYVNKKYTFDALSAEKSGYIPFTYKEWLGEDPIEVPEYTVSHTGDTINKDQIYKTKITSNYHLYDIYVSIYNADGVEVFKTATHSDYASEYELKFLSAGVGMAAWGDLDKLDPANYEYTAKIYVQSGTGDRPVLWEGKYVA